MTSRPVLMVPGWTNSGPRHWMSLWEDVHPDYQRVEQRDWEWPERHERVTTLDAVIRSASRQPILVAHSLGCITIAHWSAGQKGKSDKWIAGAMLVAPADVDAETAPAAVRGFRPIPVAELGFPTVVVASRTDPYLRFERASWRAHSFDAAV